MVDVLLHPHSIETAPDATNRYECRNVLLMASNERPAFGDVTGDEGSHGELWLLRYLMNSKGFSQIWLM